jgi:LCP family protein required for cell wall assembly
MARPVSRSTGTGRSPSAAAFLSFLWPGLGHAYAGRTRSAIIFAVPVLVVFLIIVIQVLGGIGQLASLLVSPTSALMIFVLICLLAVWRVLSMADAMTGLGSQLQRRRALRVLGLLTIVVIVTHTWLAMVAWASYDASSKIFLSDKPNDTNTADASPGPGGSPTPSQYVSEPFATPEAADARINFLITGVDSAAEREQALTDTLMVVSVDPTTRDVAMISFPRDISNFPLWNGGTFHNKINSFTTWVRSHPRQFPDGPMPSLAKELGYLLGAPIHYYVAIDLAGFRRMIDTVGGVTIDNPKALNDPLYDWLDGTFGFRLSAGVHTLDGRWALAYVRSRQGAGDNDFNRARRQQQVLLALREKLTSPAMLPNLPSIIQVAGETVKTNYPTDQIEQIVKLAAAPKGEVFQVVLGPSKYAVHPPNDQTNGIYTLELKLDALAKLSVRIFGTSSAYTQGAGPTVP